MATTICNKGQHCNACKAYKAKTPGKYPCATAIDSAEQILEFSRVYRGDILGGESSLVWAAGLMRIAVQRYLEEDVSA